MEEHKHTSIAPVARFIETVWHHPVGKWAIRGVFAGGAYAFSFGVWPFFKGWAVTRASDSDIAELRSHVTALEKKHEIGDNEHMRAVGNDYLRMTHAEQVLWLIDRDTELRVRLVDAVRVRVGLEAELRMVTPGNRADSAAKMAHQVQDKYDQLIGQGQMPELAGKNALAYFFGDN